MEKSSAIIIILSILSSIIILVLLIVFIYKLLQLYNRRQIEYYNGIKILELEKEKELLNTRITVQEETFEIIGREIHDNINQLLTLSRLTLNSINYSNLEELNSKIEHSLQFISEAILGLTNLSKSLNTEIVKEIGISKILEQEILRINSLKSTIITFDFDDDVNDVSPEIQLIIFRISQESIRNSIVHGHSKNINIKLKLFQGNIDFRIEDDGIGFDPQKINDKKLSQGLKNIKKRVELISGKFEIISKIEDGTKLKIIIPFIEQNKINVNQ